jgi:hypothetical protein
MHRRQSSTFLWVASHGKTLFCVLALSALPTSSALAQVNQGSVPRGQTHYLLNADMPPGALGQARLMRRGPVHAYYQPVQLFAPKGASISLTNGYGFTEPSPRPVRAGLQVGAVYRFQITGIPDQPGVEVYPSVEIIDRTFPPDGQAAQFPIPVHIDTDDILQALQGRLVTRVIYLEDPQTALPLAEEADTQRSFDIRSDMDPLQEADRLGRPVAVLRIGSRVPPSDPAQLQQFLLGNPPWLAIPDVPTSMMPSHGPSEIQR